MSKEAKKNQEVCEGCTAEDPKCHDGRCEAGEIHGLMDNTRSKEPTGWYGPGCQIFI